MGACLVIPTGGSQSSAATGFRSRAPTAPTPTRPTRTCSPPRWAGSIDRFDLAGERLGAVVGGAVLKHSRDFNLMRECVLGSALSPYTPAYDLQQACGTGPAVDHRRRQRHRRSGSTSRPPRAASTPPPTPRSRSATTCAASCSGCAAPSPTSTGSSWSASCPPPSASRSRPTASPAPGCRWVSTPPSPPRRWASSASTRTSSPRPATRTWPPPTTAASSTTWSAPFLGLYRDNNLRADSSAEKLAKLKPVFGVKNGDATMTAGNSTPLTDGASVALLSTDEWAAGAHAAGAGVLRRRRDRGRRLRQRPRRPADGADLRGAAAAGPQRPDACRTSTSTRSTRRSPRWCSRRWRRGSPRSTARSGSAWTRRSARIDRSKLNVNGSSLAAGHPFAATGGRIVAQLAKQLAEKKAETGKPVRGLISICAAGGQGVTAILEA